MGKLLHYNATLVERTDLNPTLAIFRVRPDQPLKDPQWYLPGQYVALGLNNDDRPEVGSVQRAMSIASAPHELDALEFYIRFVSQPDSDNPFTHILWKRKVGGRMFITKKPVGTFTIQSTISEQDQRRKIFVSAGTGLAPFVSMLRDLRHRHPDADLSNVALLHGASYPIDLGYREEMLGLVKQNQLRYFATVSRPTDKTNWKGDHGRVEDYFLPERIEETERRLGRELTPREAVVYLCGLQGTIASSIVRLMGRGFVPNNHKIREALEVPKEIPSSLFFEQYDTEPVLDLKDAALMERLRKQFQATRD